MAEQITKHKNDSKEIEKLFRSPTLDTVLMVEKTIQEYSGEFNKTQLWNKLPRKIMWSTYNIILEYLEDVNHIITAKKGILCYIWNPKLAEKFMKKRGLKL